MVGKGPRCMVSLKTSFDRQRRGVHKKKQETGHVRNRDVIVLGCVELCDAWCGFD